MASSFVSNTLRRTLLLRSSVPRISVTTRTFVSCTPPAFAKHIINVPTMGDSITEGTIVEWNIAIGDKVSEGDVVAMVETDKVTIDIKADMDGVLTDRFGEIDDTVEVGSKLYELDTEAVPSEKSSSASSSSSTPEVPPAKEDSVLAAPAEPSEVASSASSHRTPSIHFLGKDGWEKVKSGEVAEGQQQQAAVETGPVPLMYGRPIFTEEEMEALMLGGASIAPELVQFSEGAQFKQ